MALFPKNFHVIQSTNTPRCAIIVNPYKLQVTPLTEHNDDYSVWCNLNTNNKLIHFCSAFMPLDPNPTKNPEEILNSLSRTINQLKPKHYIIGSDTNGKSKLWKSRTNNRRGNLIIEFLSQNELFFLNNSDKPTYMSRSGKSIIDLTLCN